MKFSRRKFLHLATGAAALSTVSRSGLAQAYPSRPVRCLIAYPPGGGTDIFVRLVGQSLPSRLGQPFILENRPGAASNIATEMVARAPADGYTLLGTDSSAAINVTLYSNLSFNFVRDMAMVAVARGPLVLAVHPSVPATTVPELIAYAKKNPGKINFGSSGVGSSPAEGRRAVQVHGRHRTGPCALPRRRAGIDRLFGWSGATHVYRFATVGRALSGRQTSSVGRNNGSSLARAAGHSAVG
jgi:hypothetical protein